MFYLFLGVLCSSSIALIFKYTEMKRLNRYTITCVNYLTASIISLFMIFLDFPGRDFSFPSFKNFFQEFYSVFLMGGIFSPGTSLIYSAILGVLGGGFFFLSFLFYQKSINENGASLSGTFGKLGILIPMAFSLLIWNEFPSMLQWLGIILSIFSIIFINIQRNTVYRFKFSLILLFFFGGFAEFMNKLFQKYTDPSYKNIFLFFVFLSAFILSIYFVLAKGEPIKKRDSFAGFLVGIPNLFSSYFLILALNTIPASVVFPIYSSSSIIFISLGSFYIYKERLSQKQIISILLIVFSLILV